MIKKCLRIFVLLLATVGVFGFSPIGTVTAYAASCANQAGILGIPPWYREICIAGTNEIEVGSNPADFAGQLAINLLSIVLMIIGYFAVGFVIWGGIKYILAAGDSGKIASAKTTIQNALVGLLIALSAVAIITLIQNI